MVGGGIAGVVCAETLCELIAPQFSGLSAARETLSPQWRVCLVSALPTLKTVVNVRHVTRLLESFDVAERDSEDWSRAWPHILTVLIDKVVKVKYVRRISLSSNFNFCLTLRHLIGMEFLTLGVFF